MAEYRKHDREDRRVLVTGGAGFIGSHVVEAALAAGYEVAVIDNLSTGHLENLPRGVTEFYQCDITDLPAVEAAFTSFRPHYCLHLAAQIDVRRSVEDPAFDASVNIIGTLNLLETCRRSEVEKVVFASSAAVYGNPRYVPLDEEHPLEPLSPYGVSKHTAEHYLAMYRHLYGLDYVVLRYANVYGPRQDAKGEGGVVAIFTDRFLSGRPITIFGDGEQTRDFVYAGDVARANLLALEAKFSGIVNISTAVETSVNRLYEMMAKVSQSKAPPCSWVDERPGEIRRSALTNNKALAELGWRPEMDLLTGLKLTMAAQAKAAS